ncbi:hypothetical protein [Paenibacillus koleovorans]|uniref:hypothetical protein n=1 Tax=Paenibacillus koleovorans TaxID=121608 RepID=UPI0013E3C4CD|nr:hypothetical protein [Paenibacillus koleovorans]
MSTVTGWDRKYSAGKWKIELSVTLDATHAADLQVTLLTLQSEKVGLRSRLKSGFAP